MCVCFFFCLFVLFRNFVVVVGFVFFFNKGNVEGANSSKIGA